MTWPENWVPGTVPGAMAGLAGGLVFGLLMLDLGLLPEIAKLVRTDSTTVGFIVNMAVAGMIGAGFGVLVWHQQPGPGEILFWAVPSGPFGGIWDRSHSCL